MKIGMVCYASVGGQRRRRDRTGACPCRSRPSRASHQQRAAVPLAAGRAPALVPTRHRAVVSALPRTAISAGAGEYDRARGRPAAARHRARALCGAARHGGLPGGSDAGIGVPRPAASRSPPRTVTTLHGTDITLVGSDPSYARVVAFSIERSRWGHGGLGRA